jgi:hypothetical protein
MRPLLRLLPLVLAAALAGCAQAPSSTGNLKGAEKDVAATVEALQTDAQSHKPAKICSDVLSRALAEKLKSSGGDCVDEMDKLTSDADDYALKVSDVTITGSTATARVKARKGGKDNAVTTFSLALEDGKWRLTNLGAS